MPGAIAKEGQDVTLRVLEREDLDLLQRNGANPALRHLGGNAQVRDRSDLKSVFDHDDVTVFVVCLDDPGDPGPIDVDDVTRIGVANVGTWGRNPRLGIWLAPAYHGEGYGRDAATQLVDYVFRSHETAKIEAKAFDFNEPSRGLLEAIGFTQEGCLRKDAYLDGELRDAYMYGMLREEWANLW